MTNDDRTQKLLQRLLDGDKDAIAELLTLHRDRLRRMVTVRLHPKVRPRVDPSDILQDALLDAANGIDQYSRDPKVPFYLWLRFLAQQRIKMCHRRHLDVGKRSVNKEIDLPGNDSQALSAAVAYEMAGTVSSPSQILSKKELHSLVQGALEKMKPFDREILCMRHVEQLSNAEVASELDLELSTASSRYLRALTRLKSKLGQVEEFLD